MSEATREVVSAKAKSDIDLLTVSYFLSKNIAEHIELLIKHIETNHKNSFGCSHKIHTNHINDLAWHASSAGIKNKINMLLVTMYVNSMNFDAADSIFAKFIKPYLDNFEESDVLQLINGIGENNQTYWRGRANSDHKLVIARAKEVVSGFNVSKYSYLPD